MRARSLVLFTAVALAVPAASQGAQTTPRSTAAKPAAAKPAAPKPSPTATPADVDQIIELSKSGMSENLVIKTVQSSGKVYALAPADVLRLKKAGVSEGVIEAMLDTSTHAKAVAPAVGALPAVAQAAPSGNPNDREPTEKEMYEAIKADFDNANGFMKDKEAQCRSGAAKSDPALAMLCLAGALGTGGRGGLGVQLNGFKKIACARAINVAGWNCDYVQSTDMTGVASSPLLRELAQNNVTHGRFLNVEGHWALMPN